MTIQEATDLVLINGFAGNLVDYPDGFVEKSIPTCIQAAMTFCAKSAIREKRLAWFDWADVVDVSELRMKDKPKILRSEGRGIMGESYNLKNHAENDIFSLSMLYGGGGFGMGSGLVNISNQVQKLSTLQKMANVFGTDIGCDFNKARQELRPYSHTPPKRFCLIYTPEFFTIEDVTNTEWQYLIVELATAMAKKVLGTALQSYVEKGALYEDNGKNYLESGATEYKEVLERIREKSKRILVRGN